MRSALFLVLLLSASHAADVCIACEELGDAPDSNILTTLDEENANLTAYVFYENLSASPSRQPIGDQALLIQLTNTSGLNELRRAYTNADGEAVFDFNEWAAGCINFKIVYCPFCIPASPECGFEACLNFSVIETDAKNIDEVVLAEGQSVPATPNPNLYMPSIDQTPYCPPPEPMAATPALCLPLFIIFAMLAGSLYVTGRNPFAAFNIGGARVGRHIRYQARGRGYSFSGMAALSALESVARAGAALGQKEERDKKTGKVKKPGGWAALAAQEKGRADASNIVAMAKRIGGATSRGGTILSIMAGKGSLADKLSLIESTSAGAGKEGGGALIGKEGLFMPGSSPFSPRFGELFGPEGGYGLGFLTALACSTTVGGLIDSFARSTTGEGIFESIFINYDARKAKDEATLQKAVEDAFVLDEKGKIIGQKVEIAGQEVVVTDYDKLLDGTTIVTFKAEGTNAVNGKITVTLAPDTEGELRMQSMSYQVAGIIPTSDTNPQGIGIVSITQDKKGQIVASVYHANQDGTRGDIIGKPMTEPITGSPQEREQWSKLTGAYFKASAASAIGGIGNEAEHFADAITDSVRSFEELKGSMVDSIMSSYASSLKRQEDQIGGEDVERDVAETRDTIAKTAFLDIGISAEKPGDMKKISGFTPVETATKTTKAATDANLQQATDVAYYAEQFKDAGVEKEQALELAQHVVSYVNSRSVKGVNQKTDEQVRLGLKADYTRYLTDRYGMPREAAERAAANFAENVPQSAIVAIRKTARSFSQNLRNQGLGEGYIARVESARIGDLGQIQYAGATGDMSAAEILASPHCDTNKLPPAAREMVSRYKDDRAQLETIKAIPTLMDPVTEKLSAHLDFKQYGENYSGYTSTVGNYYSKMVTRHMYQSGQIKKQTYDTIMNAHENRERARVMGSYIEGATIEHFRQVAGAVSLDLLRTQSVAVQEQRQRDNTAHLLEKKRTEEARRICAAQYHLYDQLAIAGGSDRLREEANRWKSLAGAIGGVEATRMTDTRMKKLIELSKGTPIPPKEHSKPTEEAIQVGREVVGAYDGISSSSAERLRSTRERLQRRAAAARRAPGKPKG